MLLLRAYGHVGVGDVREASGIEKRGDSDAFLGLMAEKTSGIEKSGDSDAFLGLMARRGHRELRKVVILMLF